VSRPGDGVVCPGCGRTWEDARRTSHLGCARCWDTFRSELATVLQDHQGTVSVHDFPPLAVQVSERRRVEFERRLQEALAREDYAAASALRDELAKEAP